MPRPLRLGFPASITRKAEARDPLHQIASVLFVLFLVAGGSLIADPGPSLVSVSGRQLIVQKRNLDGTLQPPAPYVIRGVVWSPASMGTSTSPSDPNNAARRRPEFGIWVATDAPLMSGMNVNTARLLLDPGVSGAAGSTGLAVLDALYARGIMVIMNVDDGINDMTRISQAVTFYKDHPAILMWMLGSEWNINRYFGVASSVLDAAQRTESAASLIKSLDSNHPVATSYGEIDIDATDLRLADTASYVNTVAPSVDVWGLNIYRGATFGSLFSQWASITTKPMFIGEFGTDAWRVDCAHGSAGSLAEAMQAQWDLSLWNDLYRNLSAIHPDGVAIGGSVFELSDEWWKVSPAGSQQTGGFVIVGSHPDDFFNEEYFGLTDIERNPRQVYGTLREAFSPTYTPSPEFEVPLASVDFSTLPQPLETNLSVFFVSGAAPPGSTVTVNGSPITVETTGTFVSRFPLSAGTTLSLGDNFIDVVVQPPAGPSLQISKTVTYTPSLLTDERRLLYVDTVSPKLDGTVVIDLDAGAFLGLLEGQHVRGISPSGEEIYMESRQVFSTASHTAPASPLGPLPFSSSIPLNGLAVHPVDPFVYSRNQIVDRSSNTLLGGTLPSIISTGSSFLSASIPGGPVISPDGFSLFCCTSSSALTRIHLPTLTQSSLPLLAERTFQSDITLSPDGNLLGRVSYGGSGNFNVGFYETATFTRTGLATVSGDFAGELVFSAAGDRAVVGSAGNPANRLGGVTVINLPSLVQPACVLMDLADNLAISRRNELFVSSSNRQGIEALFLDGSGRLQRSHGFFLGINRFVVSTGIPKNDEIRRILIRELPVLAVQRAGDGTGQISSSPSGIDCGTDCEEAFKEGTTVLLIPQAAIGSTFSGWSGDPDCADGSVTLTADANCTATFTLQRFTLNVALTGNGSGSVSSAPPGITCPGDCSESSDYGSVVALTPQAATGSSFAGWSGDPDCTDGSVALTADRSCTATFTLQRFAFSVALAGNGSGSVTSAPAGIACPGDCSETYDFGSVVTLTPQAATGSTFTGWSGDLDCADGSVTITANTSCTATFTLQRFALSVALAGNGSGSVTSAPAGIACPGDCSETYDFGSVVTLTPQAATGSTFTGWSGDLDCADGSVTITANTSCTATFTLLLIPLNVQKVGAGSGLVVSSPTGIDCGADCTESFSFGTTVSLSATAEPGSLFHGWSGDEDCQDGIVSIAAPTTCIAEFLTELIFEDDFETGDASRWSVVVQ